MQTLLTEALLLVTRQDELDRPSETPVHPGGSSRPRRSRSCGSLAGRVQRFPKGQREGSEVAASAVRNVTKFRGVGLLWPRREESPRSNRAEEPCAAGARAPRATRRSGRGHFAEPLRRFRVASKRERRWWAAFRWNPTVSAVSGRSISRRKPISAVSNAPFAGCARGKWARFAPTVRGNWCAGPGALRSGAPRGLIHAV